MILLGCAAAEEGDDGLDGSGSGDTAMPATLAATAATADLPGCGSNNPAPATGCGDCEFVFIPARKICTACTALDNLARLTEDSVAGLVPFPGEWGGEKSTSTSTPTSTATATTTATAATADLPGCHGNNLAPATGCGDCAFVFIPEYRRCTACKALDKMARLTEQDMAGLVPAGEWCGEMSTTAATTTAAAPATPEATAPPSTITAAIADLPGCHSNNPAPATGCGDCAFAFVPAYKRCYACHPFDNLARITEESVAGMDQGVWNESVWCSTTTTPAVVKETTTDGCADQEARR